MKGLEKVVKYIDLVKVYTYYANGLDEEQYEDLLDGLKNYVEVALDDYSNCDLKANEVREIKKGNIFTRITHNPFTGRVEVEDKFNVSIAFDKTLTLDYSYLYNEDNLEMLYTFSY